MTDAEKVSILSQLPVKDLDDLRLFVSFLGKEFPTILLQDWAQILNRALEEKQANILKGNDDENYTFI